MNTGQVDTTGLYTASSRRRPSSSPRIPDHTLVRYPPAVTPPGQHTGAELARLLRMLRQAGADTIAIGHGRTPASVAAARALQAAWTAAGGTVLRIVDWPAAAASWLRPARRLTAGHPDAWVIADTVAGCAQVVRRPAEQPNWAATRTVGFAGLASPDLITLTTPASLAGMTGATATGGTWRVGPDRIIVTGKPDRCDDSVRAGLSAPRAAHHCTRSDPLAGLAGHHAATAAGRGLPDLVSRAGPDQGGVAAQWAPHVGPDRLPGLALAALSLHPHR